MIGQFFSSRKGAGAGASNGSSVPGAPSPPGLESATEESHTRHLLYPDSSTLAHPDSQPYPLHAAPVTPGSGHDGPLPEIDLEFPRDCRIIIAQDETPTMPKLVLFDSKPASPGPGPAGPAPAPGGLHARRSSLAVESTPPRSPLAGTFTRTRTRGASISSMPNIDEHAAMAAKAQARARESTDIVNTCLECMFGNTTMTYRGNSNKMHIVPLDTRPADPLPDLSSPGSLGRSDGMRRRSNLAKSFTPANPPSEVPRIQPDGPSREPRRRTIFITRMFSVSLPEDAPPTPSANLPANATGFPFPAATTSGTKSAPNKPPPFSLPRKSPMYAITIILHLPLAQPPAVQSSSRSINPRASTHLSTSAPGQDSLVDSIDADRRAGWAFANTGLGSDSFMSPALSSDVDDRVDVVGQHWDVIMRALTSLQQLVQERILAQFKAPSASSPPAPSQHRRAPSRAGVRDAPMHSSRKPLRLQPNAFMLDKDIQAAAELTGNRVVSGMRIPRVTTGQGKWGVWREEARWLGRWAGRREQNFFFFNLMTAFLGNHTEWLHILGPKWARRRHRELQKAKAGENTVIANRTIIVSPDKMAARRLIFLLSAFLPSNTAAIGDANLPMRPTTSASLGAYSQSPPTNMPPSRKQSLRRQINRRPRDQQSMTNMRLQPPNTEKDARSEVLEPAATDVPETSRPLGHSRRSSAHSIRTSLVIPSMSDSPAPVKSSVSSASTAIPQTTIPVAHFTLPRTRSSGPLPDCRPESSDSFASANLINTLQRSGTGQTSIASNESSNASRWSGFMNFWSGRRASSAGQSDYLQTTDDGLGFRGQERPRSQLEHMVQELSMDGVFEHGDIYETPATSTNTTADISPDIYPISGSSGVLASAARPIPERPKNYDSPLKLSVNEKDGVIDVDISLPDFGSPLQSPSLGGYGSASSQHGSSFGESSVLSMPYYEPEKPVNVAGWLSQFHPDFAIQAIKPYKELERDIKRAMSAEPTPMAPISTPSIESGPVECWVDVCTALVADTSTFSIKRLSLRRLVRLIPTPTYQPTAMTPGTSGMPPGRSQYGNPYSASFVVPMMTEIHLAEKFDTENIMDFDATLIEGVDRVLAQSGEVTRVNSAQSSRSSSRRGRRDARADSDVVPYVEIPQTDCRAVIFEALESIVKDVTAERSGKRDAKVDDDAKSIKTGMRRFMDSSLREGIRRWLTEVE
jgi:hypothetical protein